MWGNLRVCICDGSWRVLDQVQEVKYHPWFHAAYQLGCGYHMAQMGDFDQNQ
jgi:hypothetical protein